MPKHTDVRHNEKFLASKQNITIHKGNQKLTGWNIHTNITIHPDQMMVEKNCHHLKNS